MAVISATFKMVDEMSEKLANLGTTGRNVTQELNNIGTSASSLDEVSTSAEAAEESLTKVTTAVNEQENAFNTNLTAVSATTDNVTEAADELDKYAEKAEEAKESNEDLGESAKGVEDNYDGIGEKVKETSEETEKYGKKNKTVFADLEGIIASAGIIAFLKNVADGYEKCIQAASEYETSMAKVSTLADPNAMSIGDMSDDMLELSQKTGQAVSSLAEAEYQALSAGVATQSAVDFVEEANKLAVGGFTQTATAVDVLTTALNSYQLDVAETSRISDTLIMTQNLGKTTVDELAQNMGRVIPAAAAYNVEIEDLSTAYATLTANGIATAESTTNIKGMLNELGNTGSDVSEILNEKTGKTFAQLELEGKSLGDVIGILSDSVDGNTTAFANLWSSQEAGLGALSLLTSGTEKYNSTLDKMKNSTGTVNEAYETMTSTAEHSSQAVSTAATNTRIAIGSALLPISTKLNSAITTVLNNVTTFVNENPKIVQGITAAAVAVGVVTTAIVAYNLVTKLATVATTAFTAVMDANPVFLFVTAVTAVTAGLATLASAQNEAADRGKELTTVSKEQKEAVEEANAEYENACEKYGEASPYVDEYREKLDTLTTSFNENKTTVGDLILKTEELSTKYKELHDGDKTDEINNEAAATKTLSDRLFDLAGKTNLTSLENVEMIGIIKQLNNAFPELNLNYDEVLSKTATTKEALLDLVNNEYEQEKYDNAVEKYKEALGLKAEVEENLKKLLDEANPHIEKYGASDGNAQAYAEYEKFMDSMVEVTDENGETINKSFREAIEEASQTVQDLTDDVNNYADAMAEAKGITEEAADGEITSQEAVKTVIENVETSLEELATKYDEVYQSALESFSGQYNLWDEVEKVSATSVSTLMDNLDSQISYWENYANNLENLKNRNIEGLDELVSSMDDGSAESAAALAGMAEASEDDLQAMVNKYNDLQGEQSRTATSVAELKNNFNSEMDEMSSKMKGTIDDMNLSEEASKSAKDTIDAYVEKIRSGVSSASSAASAVKAAVASALSGTPETDRGYAVGTSNAEPGLALVGENGPELINFGGGEVVYTADETRQILNQSFHVDDPYAKVSSSGRTVDVPTAKNSEDRTVTIKLEGFGEITVGENDSISKEQIANVLAEQLKPVLISIVNEEIYEEGEDTYEY